MGSFLSHPVTDIEFGEEKASDLTAVFASMQGWRSSQEDAHLIKLNFDGQGSHIFGIFDGHGSELVSNYVAENFVSVLTSTDAYKDKKYDLALEQAFMRFDELLEQDSVIAELVLKQEKNSEQNQTDASSFMDVFKSRFQKLIKEQEEDDDDNESSEDNKDSSEVNGTSSTTNKNTTQPIPTADTSAEQASVSDSTPADSQLSGDSESADDSQSKTKDDSEATGKTKDSNNPQQELSEDNKVDDENEDDDDDDDDDDFSAEDNLGDEEDELASDDMRAMMADTVYERKHSQLLKPQKDRELPGYGCGTTANVILITGGKYYVANAGDSRSIMCTNEQVIALSSDHGPEVPTERERIEKAGGEIIEGRVNAGLNLSRAIGDLYYKRRSDLGPEEQLIISKPDVRIFDVKPTDRCLILACDGIWNSLSNEATAKYFETDNVDIKKQLEKLFFDVLADGSSSDGFGMDNMSVIYVHLNESNTDEDLAKFAKDRVGQSIEKPISMKRKLDDTSASEEPPAKMANE